MYNTEINNPIAIQMITQLEKLLELLPIIFQHRKNGFSPWP